MMRKLFVPTIEITYLALGIGLAIWLIGGIIYGMGMPKAMGNKPEISDSASVAKARLLSSAPQGGTPPEEGVIAPQSTSDSRKDRGVFQIPDPRADSSRRPKKKADFHTSHPTASDLPLQPFRENDQSPKSTGTDSLASQSDSASYTEPQGDESLITQPATGDSTGKPQSDSNTEKVVNTREGLFPVYCGKQFLDLIKQFEGYSSKPYLCSAKIYSIGYGSTYGVDGNHVTASHPTINRQIAERLLMRDMYVIEQGMDKLIKVSLTSNEWGALCSLTYNIGLGQFSSSTLLRKLNRGEKEDAANEFRKWIYAGRTKLAGLRRRRIAERNVFLGIV